VVLKTDPTGEGDIKTEPAANLSRLLRLSEDLRKAATSGTLAEFASLLERGADPLVPDDQGDCTLRITLIIDDVTRFNALVDLAPEAVGRAFSGNIYLWINDLLELVVNEGEPYTILNKIMRLPNIPRRRLDTIAQLLLSRYPFSQFQRIAAATDLLVATSNKAELLAGCRATHISELIGLFKQSNLSLDEPSAEGGSALLKTISRDSIEEARILLSHGASPRVSNWYGSTPLHEARQHHPGVLALCTALLDAGADVFARDNDGNTPLDLAIQRGDALLAEFFRDVELQSAVTATGGTPSRRENEKTVIDPSSPCGIVDLTASDDEESLSTPGTPCRKRPILDEEDVLDSSKR
jgi:hypothetical protein